MPTIRVELFAGRTTDQKRAFAQAVTEVAVQTLGTQAAAVEVIFFDVQKQDWASGGELWSEKTPKA